MSLSLILIAIVLAALSGAVGLGLDRRSAWGQRLAVALMVPAAIAGLTGAGLALAHTSEPGPFATRSVAVPTTMPAGIGSWQLLSNRPMLVGVDALSAFFLVPIFLIGGLGSIYGLGYWPQAGHVANGRKLRFFWGTVVAGMALLVVARHAFVFLLGWEVMALSAFFLVDTEDHLAEVRWASWLYLVSTHVGTLCLFAMFCLLRLASGSFELTSLTAGQAGPGLLTAIFVLGLVGFGLKAGIMPFHFWLPGAHASAPSHVSALMSGVLIKMGIYGLVRITGLMPPPPLAWGGLLLILGSVSGVLGVAYALGQHDLKKLLAYHSIENIGIIVMGLGLALVGRSLGRPDWVLLGLAGCLLHVWNHCLFKALLFLGAGSVVHATGTRQIDRLGGLAKAMPWTAGLFLVGAVAICGLPPLNGFISELFIYLGLWRTTGLAGEPSAASVAVAAPVLALIGALALACFVKVFGAVFLGSARSGDTQSAHEAPGSMVGPMIILAGCCGFIGLVPGMVAPVLQRAVGSWAGAAPTPGEALTGLVSLKWIGMMNVSLAGLAILGTVVLAKRTHLAQAPRVGTWDCGYARPTARMQYTASSFAQFVLGLFHWVLRPHGQAPVLRRLVPPPAYFETHVDDYVLDGQILPAARFVQRWMARFRGLQRGLTQHYVLYILATVIALLIWTLPIHQILARLLAR